MNSPRFPLCEQLGLEIQQTWPGCSVVLAENLERVLEQAPTMSSQKNDLGLWRALQPSPAEIFKPYPLDTHTARLLCIQPIVKDTAESLLREILERDQRQRFIYDADWEIRARKLLEGK